MTVTWEAGWKAAPCQAWCRGGPAVPVERMVLEGVLVLQPQLRVTILMASSVVEEPLGDQKGGEFSGFAQSIAGQHSL